MSTETQLFERFSVSRTPVREAPLKRAVLGLVSFELLETILAHVGADLTRGGR